MKLSRICAIPLLLLAWIAPVWAQFGAGQESNVKARLISPLTTVAPGSTWKLGLLLEHAPHWHTYWINPGEAGLPTEVDWSRMPPGWSVGETLWPAPIKFDVEGILGYGYEGRVVLILPVQVPETAEIGQTVQLEGTARWLECETLCIPGEAPVSISIRVGEREEAGEHAELVGSFEARVPRPLDGESGIRLNVLPDLTPAGKGDAFKARVELTGDELDPARGPEADFFPLPSGQTALEEAPETFSLEGGFGLTLAGRLQGDARGGVELAGIVKYFVRGDTEPQHRVIRVPLTPPAAAAGAAAFTFGQLLRAMFLALIGGLILNIMPCVLPVISLKVFSFVKQAGESRARLFMLGLFYCLGVLVSFWILASVMIAIKAAGGDANWGALFQYPLFVILMSGVIFTLALNLFGVYEISAPGGATVQGLAELQEREGPLGAFFMGILATVLATPCSAPFLGTAIAFAIPQPAPIIVAIFTAVGLGLALPFLILSAFPAWTRFIPRPGPWMVRFKEVMGFLLMATAVWLLYVVGQLLGVEGLAWTLAFLLALGLACWMIGSFITYASSPARRWAVRALALVVALVGYGYFVHLFLHPVAHDHPIAWVDYSPAALENYRGQNRIVFLDATAEWCLTCKANEKFVIETGAVREKFDQLDVVAMRADFTRKDAVIAELLARFNRRGVPLYVIYPPNRGEPITLPEAITPGMVLEGLEAARAGS